MGADYVDIEDEAGTVIGQLDLTTMRVVAPNATVDAAIAAGASIYMRRNGMRSALTVDKPKKRRRQT